MICEGRVVVITGAARGIGAAHAEEFRRQGAHVIANDVDGGDHSADVSTWDGAKSLVDKAVADHGRLDVLVNNAGVVGSRVAALDTGAADLLACYDTNVFGPVRVTRAFLPLLRRSAAPRIVMVSSGMGSITRTGDPDRVESSLVSLGYPSSKTALNMITTQYAKALPEFRVNAADPGFTATDLNDHRGYQTVEEGSDAIVALATVAPDGPTGGFFDRGGPVPW